MPNFWTTVYVASTDNPLWESYRSAAQSVRWAPLQAIFWNQLIAWQWDTAWRWPAVQKGHSMVRQTKWSGQGRRSYGTGETCPPNILEVLSFRMSTRVTATACLLYFNANIMYSFTKKLQLLGTSSSRPPYGAPPLDPDGGLPSPRYQVFFYVNPQ